VDVEWRRRQRRRHVFLNTTTGQEVKVVEADLEAGASIVHVVKEVGAGWR
jgi:hypothetical protein